MQRAKRDLKAAATSDTLKKDTDASDVPSSDMQVLFPLCFQPFCDHTCESTLPCCRHNITYHSDAQVKPLAFATKSFTYLGSNAHDCHIHVHMPAGVRRLDRQTLV
jgi:hypothetical protein